MKLQTLIRTNAGKALVLASLALPVLEMTLPGVALAQAVTEKPSTTFEIKIQNDKLNKFFNAITISTTEAEAAEIETVESVEVDPVAVRAEQLREFFNSRGATQFAAAAETLAAQPEWKKITTIAFAESTYRSHVGNNYWGITYRGKLARYSDLNAAIVDVNRVLAKSYSTRSYEQMCGIYVQPCNKNWLKANHQIAAAIAHIQ